jgi:hypothetical protein
MSATDYLELKVLDHCLKNTPFAQPPNLYMALHTANPGETGTSNEVTGGSYARQVVAFNAASGGQSVSNGAVNFASMPAVTVTHFSIFDAVSGGNPLFNGPLSASQTVSAGATLAFAAGQVIITCD